MPSMKNLAHRLFQISCTQYFQILFSKEHYSEMALCILWSGVMEWSHGLEPRSGFLEWNIGVKCWSEKRNINSGGKICLV